MLSYLARKTSLLLVGWFCASLLIFFTLRLLPGDVAQVIGGTRATPATIARIRSELGLDKPLWQQYTDWVGGVFVGDLGTSLVSKTAVADQLLEKAEVTLPLVIFSAVIALLIAVPLGVWTAFKNHTPAAGVATAVGLSGAAAPPVWVALLCVTVLANWLHIFPAQGFPTSGWQDPLAALHSLALPAFTIGLIEAAVLFRFVRSAALNALKSAPVKTGMSFGYTRLQSLLRYGMPEASLSLLGTLGIQIASLVVGAVVIEQLFALPGIGTMLISDVGSRDLPKVASVLFVITGFILLLGFILDLIQTLLDPRLKPGAVK